MRQAEALAFRAFMPASFPVVLLSPPVSLIPFRPTTDYEERQTGGRFVLNSGY